MSPVSKKPVASPKKLILQREILRRFYAGNVGQVIFSVDCSKSPRALSCGANSPCLPEVRALIKTMKDAVKAFEQKLPTEDKKVLKELRKG